MSLFGSRRQSRSNSLRCSPHPSAGSCTARRFSNGAVPRLGSSGSAQVAPEPPVHDLLDERRPSLEEAMGDHAFDRSIADPRSRPAQDGRQAKPNRRSSIGGLRMSSLRPGKLGVRRRASIVAPAAEVGDRAGVAKGKPGEQQEQQQQHANGAAGRRPSVACRRPSLCATAAPATATTAGRRRSVDAGLGFNERRTRAPAVAPAVGALKAAPQRRGSFGSCGGSECLRKSEHQCKT